MSRPHSATENLFESVGVSVLRESGWPIFFTVDEVSFIVVYPSLIGCFRGVVGPSGILLVHLAPFIRQVVGYVITHNFAMAETHRIFISFRVVVVWTSDWVMLLYVCFRFLSRVELPGRLAVRDEEDTFVVEVVRLCDNV